MYGWHCLYHCTAGSLTSLMEIRAYDPKILSYIKMYRWHCLYHCTAGSLTSLMEIRTYDPRSKEPLLYNLSYLVVLKFGLETAFLINIMNLWCVAHYTWLLMRQYPSLVFRKEHWGLVFQRWHLYLSLIMYYLLNEIT